MQDLSLLIDAWPVSDPGQAKPHNEDFVAVYEPDNPQVRAYAGNLYVVTDGAGESASGQMASRYAALKIISEYYKDNNIDLGLRLRRAIQDVNGELYRYVERNPELKKISSTVVAAAIRGEQFHLASVGDSRAYLVRRGQLVQLTRDHTLVAGLVEQRTITPDEAKEHPQRDVLLRNLGSQPTVEVDIYDGRLAPDDRLILSTNGLTRYVDGPELADLATESQPTTAAERMVALANERGGHDNITVVVLGARMGIPTPRTPLPFTWDGREPVLGAPDIAARPPITEAPQAQPPLAQPPTPPTQPPPAQPYTPPVQPAPAAPIPAASETQAHYPAPVPTPYAQPSAPAPEPIPRGGQPKTYHPPDSGRGPARGGSRNILIGVLAVVVLIAAGVVAATTLLPLLNIGGEPAETGQDEQGETPVVVFTAPPEAVTLPPPTLDPAAAEPTQQLTPPGMVLIEAGEFLRGVDDDEITLAVNNCIREGGGACPIEVFDDATPQQNVTLGAFYMDRTEVTNAQYALCVAAGGCDPPIDTTRYDDPAYTNHPVTNVTWAQAATYCAWADKRLPTEAEWEKAARGAEARIWPWGDTWEAGKANTAAAQLGGPSTVESFAGDVSPYGIIGMAGNVSEWVQDWYQGNYENLGLIDPQGPLAQPGDEPIKVARGGSYLSLSAQARGAMRLDVNSGNGADWLGFRCAASLVGAPTGTAAEETPAESEGEGATETPEATVAPTPTSATEGETTG